MAWEPIDFQSTVALDRNFAERLIRHFEDKEMQTAQAILTSVHINEQQGVPPLSLPEEGIKISLHESVEAFSRKIRQTAHSKLAFPHKDRWKITADEINRALWDYLEVLEEAVRELFLEIDHLGFFHWKTDFMHTLAFLKEAIAHRLEDFLWVVKRMETKLWEYKCLCEQKKENPSVWKKLYTHWSPILDRSLLDNLDKTLKLLHSRYDDFLRKADRYFKQNEVITKSVESFDRYKVFWALDSEHRKLLMQLYKNLKLWEANTSAKFLPENDVIFALRGLTSPERIVKVFRDYLVLLRTKLYDSSRAIKLGVREAINQWVRKDAIDYLAGLRTELQTLHSLIAKYREFLTKTNHEKKLWDSFKAAKGTETALLKTLTHLMQENETIAQLSMKLSQAIESSPENIVGKKCENAAIERILQEMSQPLLSKKTLRNKAENLVKHVEDDIDELGSFDRDAINYTNRCLARGMRLDWKYNTLHSIPAFQQLYEIHEGLLGPMEDRTHANRLARIKKILHHFQKWMEENRASKHAHDIESDLTDIKGYLQDFFASLQRIPKEESNNEEKGVHVEKMERFLLEYRYVFGEFFSKLNMDNPDERLLRHNFLFVDQYFEAAETKLVDLRAYASG